MRGSNFILVFNIVALLSSTLAAADWPTYLRDATRVGASSEEFAAPFALRWVHASAAPTESAWEGPRNALIEGKAMKHRVRFDDADHVAIIGDRAYFGSSVDHQARCVDVATGKLHWSFFTGGPIRLA
ncbi:MAG: hypothetical protein N2C14_30370, partial [Planctomycetales bacterium]